MNKKSALNFNLFTIRFIFSLFSLFLLFPISLSHAAQYVGDDFDKLLEEANRKGYVRLLITLDDTITVDEIKTNHEALRVAMAAKAQTVLADLGQNVLPTGYWNNGYGQMGAYVNESGIHALVASDNAIAFIRDVTHTYRIKAADSDGSVEAIESAIITNGAADVNIFLNVEVDGYDIDSTGNTVYNQSSATSEQIQTSLNHLLSQPYANGINNPVLDENRPVIRANINRSAFYALIESNEVRAIRPVDYTDPRAAQWPQEVLDAAQEQGEADILISLRGGEFFSPKTGYMSPAAIQAQADAHRRIFDDIFTRIGAPTSSENEKAYLDLGIVQVRLPNSAVTRLYELADARILNVELNKPAAQTTLTNSTVLLNLAPYWAAGITAAGQYMVIIDSGIRKNHAFFTTSGVSRVAHEACFGTNTTSGGVTYSSICPNQDGAGDSPFDWPGAGEPFSNLTACNTLAALGIHNCSHGTHVGGIAAGRQTSLITPSNLQGVGPDAFLVAAQVFSYNTTNPNATAFGGDILAALNAVYINTAPGTLNPFVANLSLGGTLYPSTATCLTGLNTVVNNLTSRGVPVIASTGNEYDKSQIAWPACTANVIKVSSVLNDSTGTTVSDFANIATQANFTGPILLAPGGGSSTYVRSSTRTTTTSTEAWEGTSMAAPHVAGVYAGIKAADPTGPTVAAVTAYIVSTGSIPVTVNLPGVGNETFRRVRLP
ncbi:S8 family peptidase [Nitrosomonas halophila]|uniref:Subtilase family protein n=1 Tax=Nitrosomonas halophila TaxID=44576 RepID=A0A1H3LVT7_9PROT|nr:S8 family serine peptidase [Nitrosomonas halophila]SDY68108.1 Subtilase family protein [Nitrosomonas halophila]